MVLASKKGLTLIEIIISMAILGIILVSFITMFTAGFTTVFTQGRKTQAVVGAQQVMDQVILSQDPGSQISDLVDDGDLYLVTDPNDPQYDPNSEAGYYIENTTNPISGEPAEELTIFKFYQEGERYVQVTSIIP